MAITISGTTGIAGVDGSAGTPAVQGTDTNTGVFYPAADTVGVSTGGSERMRVDSSGNVGIGTSSPSYKLDVRSTLAVLDGSSNIGFYANGSTYTQIWQTLQSTNDFIIQTTASKYISFGINSAEKVRIDTSGNLLVGTTSSNGKISVDNSTDSQRTLYVKQSCATSNAATTAVRFSKSSNTSTTGQVFVEFTINNDAAGSGQINANGASQAAFGSFSDSRLKENIVDLPSQLANIMALRPVEFDYIESEGGGHQIGFIAQEVKEIYPDLVGEREDGMFTLSDLNKNDARLIKAVQELKALVDTQASTITALTARIEALETK